MFVNKVTSGELVKVRQANAGRGHSLSDRVTWGKASQGEKEEHVFS